MIVYVLSDNPPYEPGTVVGVFSTRELAEAALAEIDSRDWNTRDYDIDEWEMDSLGGLPEPIQRWHGPRTKAQQEQHDAMSRVFNTLLVDTLKADSPFLASKSLPVSSGKTIQFFTYSMKEPEC